MRKKIEKSKTDYLSNELEFLSMMKPNETVIAIISGHDQRRQEAVNWLSHKLRGEVFVTGVSLDIHSSEFFKKLDPDILIGDSLNDFSLLMNEKPLELFGNGGYIYFKRSSKEGVITEWLKNYNRGQHLVEVWIRLNKN